MTGSFLATGSMLLLVYALVRAPGQGWASTRPVIVAGSLIAAAGIFYLSRIPVHGSYLTSLLPGLIIMSIGPGAVLVSVTTAANAGVAADRAGLAAGLLSTSQQLGTALDLAIFSAIATARTSALLIARTPRPAALTAGFPASPAGFARSSCSPPPSSPCAPPTPAASRQPSPGTSPAAATGCPQPKPPTEPTLIKEYLTMNITVFGASGGIGTHVVELAVRRGHQVRGIYRTPPLARPANQAEILVGPDIFDPGFAAQAIRGADVVVAAVGPNFAARHNPRTTMISPPDLHQRLARTLVAAMTDSAAPARLISVSTASMGPADTAMWVGPRLLLRFFRTVVAPNLGRVGADLQAMETELAASGLDWYALRPVKLTDGPLTGHVQASDRFAMKSISRADVAWHILTLAGDPRPRQHRTPVITSAKGGKSRAARTVDPAAQQAPADR